MAKNEVEILKKPYKRELWTTSQILEVTKCIKDPIYFVEKYMRVQHPTKGSVPLILYPYQKEMITAFKEHRNIVCLTG